MGFQPFPEHATNNSAKQHFFSSTGMLVISPKKDLSPREEKPTHDIRLHSKSGHRILQHYFRKVSYKKLFKPDPILNAHREINGLALWILFLVNLLEKFKLTLISNIPQSGITEWRQWNAAVVKQKHHKYLKNVQPHFFFKGGLLLFFNHIDACISLWVKGSLVLQT